MMIRFNFSNTVYHMGAHWAFELTEHIVIDHFNFHYVFFLLL